MRAGGRDWPRGLLENLTLPLRPSAVLIPIVEKRGDLTMLLTQRAEDLTHHAGQISFPGGGMEPGDLSLTDTALREAEEEIGIRKSEVEIAGYLAPMPTISGYAVTPVVGLLNGDLRLQLDKREVAAAFEVPLEFLLDPANQEHGSRSINGIDVPIITYQFQSWRIWGATAAMIVELHSKLI
ncbi:MAG: CoA pyrophosphatase [Woeseia sp.]|nr:CoA pyrophosphatase [Woeseia sp.]NNL54694.1 CoA pyrophosphatase [Woeseia sp.]